MVKPAWQFSFKLPSLSSRKGRRLLWGVLAWLLLWGPGCEETQTDSGPPATEGRVVVGSYSAHCAQVLRRPMNLKMVTLDLTSGETTRAECGSAKCFFATKGVVVKKERDGGLTVQVGTKRHRLSPAEVKTAQRINRLGVVMTENMAAFVKEDRLWILRANEPSPLTVLLPALGVDEDLVGMEQFEDGVRGFVTARHFLAPTTRQRPYRLIWLEPPTATKPFSENENATALTEEGALKGWLRRGEKQFEVRLLSGREIRLVNPAQLPVERDVRPEIQIKNERLVSSWGPTVDVYWPNGTFRSFQTDWEHSVFVKPSAIYRLDAQKGLWEVRANGDVLLLAFTAQRRLDGLGLPASALRSRLSVKINGGQALLQERFVSKVCREHEVTSLFELKSKRFKTLFDDDKIRLHASINDGKLRFVEATQVYDFVSGR